MIPPFVALFSWPLISVILFNRYSIHVAVMLTILVGYLFLPEKTSIDLPLLPPLGKATIPSLSALLWAAVLVRKAEPGVMVLPGAFPKMRSMYFLIALLVGGAFMTVITNGDTLRYGPTVLPALRPYDAFSSIMSAFLFILPTLLARKYFASPQAHRTLLKMLVYGGLAYSAFIIIELRMSPLFHYWVYGYFPHSWIQHVRSYGWRPVVFMSHGLLVGIFIFATVIAAAGLLRSKTGRKGFYIFATIWLMITLVISTNFGALLIALTLLPILLLTGIRTQLITAAVIAGLFLSYPLLREAKLIPLDRVVEFAASVNENRANSFMVRLRFEDAFLEKISERSLFGWGGWGRSRSYNEVTGDDVTLADGAWVITLSVSGWTGYIARFGIITLPLFFLVLHRRRYNIGPETAALALIAAGNLVDLIPNASLTPITAIVAGALWGRVELGTAANPTQDTETVTMPGRKRLVDRNLKDRPALAGSAQTSRETSYTRQTDRIQHTRTSQK
jgi:hypothetical protein